jgi:hypothetical protein
MSCTWNITREYSEFVLLQGRGDTGIFETVYRPAKSGVKVAGEAVYVNSVDPSNMTVSTTSPCSTGYLAGNACNSQEALTKFLPFVKQCFDDCQWDAVMNDASMMLWGQGMAKAALNILMPLIYSNMVANGTRIFSDATPTNAQLADAILRAIFMIQAEGGGPGGIILDLTTAAGAIQGLGALFQPLNLVTLDYTYGPGRPVGTVAGYPVFLSKDNLIDIAPSPDEQVDFIVYAKMGYAYASVGEGVGLRISTQAIDGTNSIVLSGCIGYGTLGIVNGATDTPLIIYCARADS